MDDCPFCLPRTDDQAIFADDHCYVVWTDDTGTPEGSAMVIPWAHRATIWDLTSEEWTSTHGLLHQARQLITRLHAPDGWNVGWNVGTVGGQTVNHAHCHLVPRYQGEPLAGRGIRAFIKDVSNRPVRHRAAPDADLRD